MPAISCVAIHCMHRKVFNIIGDLPSAIQFNERDATTTDVKPGQASTPSEVSAAVIRGEERRKEAVAAISPTRTIRVGPGGDASTVAGGIAMVPRGASERWMVTVAPGVYRERVWVPADVGPLTLAGAGSETSMLVYHCCPGGNGRPR